MVYKKWRELSLDPYEVKYKNIELIKIISYLPAGNDVLECLCMNNEDIKRLILKFERSKMADFEAEYKIIKYLKKTNFRDVVPSVIETGKINNKRYLVLEKKEGNRLSDLFRNNKIDKYSYLYKYGESLAKFHSLIPNRMFVAKQRIINDIPSDEIYGKIDEVIKPYIDYLENNKPIIDYNTFIHGDYHYANILWKYKKISGLLDFEYSGMGFKEQDIAWALVLRPMQDFMDNKGDIKGFLDGYLSIGKYDKDKLKWCLINAYCHFFLMNCNNKKYVNKILKLISNIDQFVI